MTIWQPEGIILHKVFLACLFLGIFLHISFLCRSQNSNFVLIVANGIGSPLVAIHSHKLGPRRDIFAKMSLFYAF